MEAHVRDEWPRYTEEPVTDLPVHPLAPKLNVEGAHPKDLTTTSMTGTDQNPN